MSYIPSPDILALIDHTPIAEAQAEIDAANARFHEAKDAVLSAEAELADARAVIPSLTERAVAGERISMATVARAHARVRDVDRYRAFVTEVAHRLRPDEREADARLSAARARAYDAVLDRGIDMQIAAAERADKAGGTVDRLPNHSELEVARAEFESASTVVAFAIRSGARPVRLLAWPLTGNQVRRSWGREEAVKEAA